MLGATILTAFNDNAAITFLSSLVPTFTDSLKYAVVTGAVADGDYMAVFFGVFLTKPNQSAWNAKPRIPVEHLA